MEDLKRQWSQKGREGKGGGVICPTKLQEKEEKEEKKEEKEEEEKKEQEEEEEDSAAGCWLHARPRWAGWEAARDPLHPTARTQLPVKAMGELGWAQMYTASARSRPQPMPTPCLTGGDSSLTNPTDPSCTFKAPTPPACTGTASNSRICDQTQTAPKPSSASRCVPKAEPQRPPALPAARAAVPVPEPPTLPSAAPRTGARAAPRLPSLAEATTNELMPKVCASKPARTLPAWSEKTLCRLL